MAERPRRRGDAPHELVAVLELHDPVRAEMAADLLRQEGIPVVVSGLHHNSLLGAFGSVIRIVLRVPARDGARAVDLLDALSDEVGAELVDDPATPPELFEGGDVRLDEPTPADGDPYRAASPRRARAGRGRSATTAALLALFPSFGSGHVYVDRARTAAALAGLELAALALAATGVEWALVGVPAAMALDAAGAVRVTRAERLASSRRSP